MVINPYTFLPIDEPADERAPGRGHALLGPDGLSGTIEVKIRARTPLSIGSLVGDGEMPPREFPGGAGARVIIPGSSVAGSVRATHEAMNNSCLRVVDPGYRAVHRHPMVPATVQGLKMAVVTMSTRGVPDAVQICEDVRWVHQDDLAGADGSLPRTGDRFDLEGFATYPDSGRTLLHRLPGDRLNADPQGPWVLLVTQTTARPAAAEVHFASGRPTPESIPVQGTARARFAQAVTGSPDMQKLRNVDQPNQPHYVDLDVPAYDHVTWPSGGHGAEPIGLRRLSRGATAGTPVWVRTTADGQEVVEVRLAVAWRRTSEIRMEDRIPDHARPCTDPRHLCTTCSVFGSAGSDESAHAQNSYRGHVRFQDAVAQGIPTVNQVTRAPLSSPRPTAGQFYLDNTGWNGMSDLNIPLAHWGSTADQGNGVRPVRGRKFYWRTRPTNVAGPGVPTPGHRALARTYNGANHGLDKVINLIGAGAEFTTTVTFDNLSAAQLGSLLVALDPRLYLTGDVVTTVGGGRPFGWGAINTTITGLKASTACHRYLGTAPGSPRGCAEQIADYVKAYEQSTTVLQDPHKSRLTKVLTLNPTGVRDQDVWYPIPAGAQRNTRSGDQTYRWFGLTNGQQFEDRAPRRLQSLPHVDAHDQSLPESAQ